MVAGQRLTVEGGKIIILNKPYNSYLLPSTFYHQPSNYDAWSYPFIALLSIFYHPLSSDLRPLSSETIYHKNLLFK